MADSDKKYEKNNSTIDAYNYILKKRVPTFGIIVKQFTDPQKIYKILKNIKKNNGENYSDSYIKQILCAIQYFLKINGYSEKLIEDYGDIISKISDNINKKLANNVRNVKQNKKKIAWLDFIELAKKQQLNIMKRMMLDFLTLAPIRRTGDYYNLVPVASGRQMKKKNHDRNYYVYGAKKPYLMFFVYKTAQTFGPMKIFVDENLHRSIMSYVKEFRIKDNQPLFHMFNNQTSFINFIKETLGGNRTINDIRSSFITYIVDNSSDLGISLSKKKYIARRMGTSVEEMDKTYRKLK
jgi:hypothetical protein